VTLGSQQVEVPLTIAATTPPAPAPPAAVPPVSEPQVAAPRKPVSVTGSRAVLGTLGCPGGCHVAKRLGSVKIGGRKFKLAVKLPADIAAGASAPLMVVLPKPVLSPSPRAGPAP
jgi:hypothetical protein